MTTIAQSLANAQQQLVASDTSRLDAEVLLAFVLACDRAYLFTWPDKTLTPAQINHFEQLTVRRVSGEPIAYITGKKEFWSLSLQVNPSTLIPRPETELLVELALQKLPPAHCKIIDLGTGTGAIALALAKERPLWHVYACDINSEAVLLAQHNAAQLNLHNITVFENGWLHAMDEKLFDLVISNPPYLAPDDPHLFAGDVRFEPKLALVSPMEGLADLEMISRHAFTHLQFGGWLLLEHGYQQGAAVRVFLQEAGYTSIETVCDLSGHERVTMGQRGG